MTRPPLSLLADALTLLDVAAVDYRIQARDYLPRLPVLGAVFQDRAERAEQLRDEIRRAMQPDLTAADYRARVQ